MNRNEVIKILAVVRVAYPNSYSKFTNADLEALISLWGIQFKDYDYDIVNGALNTIISTDKSDFAPTIARIKEVCGNLLSPNKMTEIEAWNCVKQAMHNAGYNSKEEFEKLPTICKELVGSSDRLFAWSMMPTSEVETVVHSNFVKEYRSLERVEAERALIPSSVKLMLEDKKNEFNV